MTGLFRPSIDGLVPYEPGKPVEAVQRELGLEHVVKLASNEGPFPPFPAALEAMERAALELNRYPDGGAWTLRTELAQRNGVAFEELIVGAGADGIIDLLAQATLDPGDDVVCGWPSFPSYVLTATKLGAEPRRIPLRDHTYEQRMRELHCEMTLVALRNIRQPYPFAIFQPRRRERDTSTS